MGTKTGIEWTDATFKSWIDEKHWDEPLKWNKRCEKNGTTMRVFCASMADVFDSEVDQEHRDELWALMWATPRLTWLVLTKRIGNAAKMLPSDWGSGYPNVWLGITVVNQEEADRDLPKFAKIPTSIRFLSLEPMLGRIDLDGRSDPQRPSVQHWDYLNPSTGHIAQQFIHWVVVGGESGPHARPMHPDWVRSIRDQCQAAGVPFFFKQWGSWGMVAEHGFGGRNHLSTHTFPRDNGYGVEMIRIGKKAAGSLLDGRTWHEFPHC